ncbi:MAG: 2-C-methyl-D-erythritol 2,4-cyclodiphosphate synthase [Sedimentisphaerales bacterium]|nr:2-C-methyl-D-erythritol 2,4-cyclodiphosphate synthase [Sedimentisphaerales bacterium]
MSISRVGHGYDIHSLAPDRKLVLGGVEIPYKLGLAGHSDADVVLHAVIDAMLGAAALGDIGEMYPDTDPAYKNADSGKLLEKVYNKIKGCGYRVANLDVTIIAQKPRLSDYKDQMRQSIARLLGIDTADVNIKAKTNEGFDAVGQGKAIVCHAVVGLVR